MDSTEYIDRIINWLIMYDPDKLTKLVNDAQEFDLDDDLSTDDSLDFNNDTLDFTDDNDENSDPNIQHLNPTQNIQH